LRADALELRRLARSAGAYDGGDAAAVIFHVHAIEDDACTSPELESANADQDVVPVSRGAGTSVVRHAAQFHG